MSEDKFKNQYRIPSARAQWHDYLGGAYFVTICTKDREFYLGTIEEGQMHLSEIGKYANEQFRDVSMNYPYAEIPSYVVMPNHIHAIVIIDDRHVLCRDAIHRVSNPSNPPIHRVSNPSNPPIHRVSNPSNPPIHRVSHRETSLESNKERGGVTSLNNPMLYRSLGLVIRGLKARVTRYANESGLEFAWQSRFHDRIIRDQKDMNEISIYISNNVVKWFDDELHR